jgi:hypothetical protein
MCKLVFFFFCGGDSTGAGTIPLEPHFQSIINKHNHERLDAFGGNENHL